MPHSGELPRRVIAHVLQFCGPDTVLKVACTGAGVMMMLMMMTAAFNRLAQATGLATTEAMAPYTILIDEHRVARISVKKKNMHVVQTGMWCNNTMSHEVIDLTSCESDEDARRAIRVVDEGADDCGEDSAEDSVAGGGESSGEKSGEESGEESGKGSLHHGGVYVLANLENRRTYVGCAWSSFHHRLRQHNREIKGGARATAGSCTWHHRLLVTGFTGIKAHVTALSFEWYVKRYRRFDKTAWKGVDMRDPVARRRRQIELLLRKFGSTKFQGLSLHEFAPPPRPRLLPSSSAPSSSSAPTTSSTRSSTPLTCRCFDCFNRGLPPGEIGQRMRMIRPSRPCVDADE